MRLAIITYDSSAVYSKNHGEFLQTDIVDNLVEGSLQKSRILGEISYASSATVSLGYRGEDVPHPLNGFGFVVPRAEHRAILACTFSSVKYAGRAPEGHVLLRCFLGGALNAAILEGDDATLAARARDDLRAALGVTAEPVLTRVWRHPASMPQYHLGHLARVDAIEGRLATLPGLFLVGGAYRGVGIADCVRSGEAATEHALELTGSAGDTGGR